MTVVKGFVQIRPPVRARSKRGLEDWMLLRYPILVAAAILSIAGATLVLLQDAAWLLMLGGSIFALIGILAILLRVALLPRLESTRRHLDIPSVGSAVSTAAALVAPLFVIANAALIRDIRSDAFENAKELHEPFMAYGAASRQLTELSDLQLAGIGFPKYDKEVLEAIKNPRNGRQNLIKTYDVLLKAFPSATPTLGKKPFPLKILEDRQVAILGSIDRLLPLLEAAVANPAAANAAEIKAAAAALASHGCNKNRQNDAQDPICEIMFIESRRNLAWHRLRLNNMDKVDQESRRSLVLSGPIGLLYWAALAATIGLTLRLLRLSQSRLALLAIGLGTVGLLAIGMMNVESSTVLEKALIVYGPITYLIFLLLPQLRGETGAALFWRFLLIALPVIALLVALAMVWLLGIAGVLLAAGVAVACYWLICRVDQHIVVGNCRPR